MIRHIARQLAQHRYAWAFVTNAGFSSASIPTTIATMPIDDLGDHDVQPVDHDP
jgi:hypothetical protein